MPVWSQRNSETWELPFRKRRQLFRIIAAISIVSLLVSCAGHFRSSSSLQASGIYSSWLKQERRSFLISTNTQSAQAQYKVRWVETHKVESYGIAQGGGAGAAAGLGEGVKACLRPDAIIACPVILPLFMLIGLGLGAGVGAMPRSVSIEMERDLDLSKFRKEAQAIGLALEQMDFERSIQNRIKKIGLEKTKHDFDVESSRSPEPLKYPTSPSQGRLELSFERFELVSNEKKGGQFRLQIELFANTRLRIEGVACRYSGGPYSYESEGRTLDKWATNDAQVFRTEIAMAIDTLSNRVTRSVLLEPSSLDPNYCLNRIEVFHQAKNGDSLAQYMHGRDTPYLAERKKWFCLAANNGNAAALYGLARLYYKEMPLGQRDPIKAYQYFLLGEKAMSASADYLAPGVRKLPETMNQAQISAAKSAARNWKPDPKACGN